MSPIIVYGLVAVALCVGLPYKFATRPTYIQTVAGRSTSEVMIPGPDQNAGDDGPTLQRAINSVADTGGVVRVHAGVYRLIIRDGIRALAPRRNVQIIGDGPAQTILRLVPGQPAYNGVLFPERSGDDL